MAFVLGLVALGVALWFLIQLKKKDTAACAEVLGLKPAPARTERGITPEGFKFSQTTMLEGRIDGRAATLWSRTLARTTGSKRSGRRSMFTVLDLTLRRPARVPLRIQPVGVLGALEEMLTAPDNRAARVAMDARFDEAYTVYSASATDAIVALTPALRESLLEFRARVAGPLPSNVAGHLASGLVLGTFYLDGAFVRYAVYGSPTKATAEHVKAAVPIMIALARAAGGE